MRRTLMITTLALATLSAAMLPQAAEAGTSWLSFGTGFRVGPSHLSFVYGNGYHRHEPSFFVRFDSPIRYSGHHCSRYCFHEAGAYYHDRSCPVYLAHLRHYRVDPYWAFDSYAPRVTFGGGYYRDYGRGYYRDYDRGYHRDSYRYDRRHDRRDDRRHDRFDRRDGRRHDRFDRRDDRRHDRFDRRDDRRHDRFDRRDDRRHDRHDRRDDRRHDRRGGDGRRHRN